MLQQTSVRQRVPCASRSRAAGGWTRALRERRRGAPWTATSGRARAPLGTAGCGEQAGPHAAGGVAGLAGRVRGVGADTGACAEIG